MPCGHALETVVYNELERRGAETAYVRTSAGGEVDLLARNRAAGQELLQVCANTATPETLAREIRALEQAAIDHPRARPRLLVLDRDFGLPAGATGVVIQPADEWLLSPEDQD